jgi:putative hydrolase of the HAD superfamily
LRIQPAAIIFDYGNVLCQPQAPAARQAMAAILNMPVAPFEASYWRFRLAFDEAALDPPMYWNSVAQRAITPAEIAQLTEIDNQSWSHPDPVMPAWARQLRATGLRTAILSNMPLPVREHLDTVAWLPEFDQRTFSCDVRLAKPGREIYELCLNGLGVQPSAALFLDDRADNIRAAEALGIHSILFTTPADLASALHSRFDTPVSLIAKVK